MRRPTITPRSCDTINPATDRGDASKVLLRERAIVVAGFAKEVDAVNQEVAPIQADIRRDVVVLTFRQSG